jgi:hypothetical protein
MTLEFNSTTSDRTPENGAETGLEASYKGPDTLPLDAPIKRGRGAPKGNANNLRHGAYSRDIERAKRRKLRGSARRREIETLSAVLADQGNLDDIPVTLHFVARRFSRRVGWLHRMDKAVDKLLRQNPKVRDNVAGLAKLYDLTRAVENDAIADAKAIGFERVAAEEKDLNAMLDDMRREQAEEETKQ